MYKVIVSLFIFVSLSWGEDYYEILGISKSADQEEIRKAFKKLAIIYHPDKNTDDPNAHDKFVRLTKAYETLKDDNLRKTYDLYGEDSFNESHIKQTYSWNHYQDDFVFENPYVIILERSDYYESVIDSNSSWFVNFYSPMCSHCHDLAPTWKKIAKLLDGIVKIAAVNCVKDMQLCSQEGIRVYPTLFYFHKNSRYREDYKGENTEEAITRFVLDRLNIHVPEISESQWKLFLRGKDIVQRPMLIFICGNQQNCFTFNERLIVAVTLDNLVDVRMFICENDNCHEKMSYNTHAVYLPTYNASWAPLFLDDISDINTLIEKISDEFPNLQELSDNDFEHIRKLKSNVAWLVCFYITDIANLRGLNLHMKRFSADVNLGKMNCSKNRQLCSKLGINRYPIWGMLKPGGAFELNHGENFINGIINFVQISMKTTNVWALSEEEALSILQRNNGDEVWFLDWYSPWCPPCIRFMTEFRKASLEFDASIIHFGTIDCTIHRTLCHQYKINAYPTSILINGSDTYQFMLSNTAANVIKFINEKRNPSVIKLTSKTFHHKLAKKKKDVIWIVDYFVPWCEPCRRLDPEWTAVSKSLSSLSFVKIASVDCETEASLCNSHGVRSYPTIRLYPLKSEGLNTIALYNGQRDSLSILTWITAFFPKKIRELSSSDYQKLLNSKTIWIVNFYSPNCQQCRKIEPEFAIAAQSLEKVKFGKIHCGNYIHECAGIRFLPTLMLYNSKQKKQNRYGVKIIARTAEAIKDEILEIINSRTKHDEL